ncbi:NAD(P)-dependent oxidoreductase [Actinoplanes utahensis]|uniref:NAD(P)-dependent oxidoreductase n=1 Tax=Actinoplanes utahensis TaxID=1869 RepID=UPI00068E93F0|nr:NAD(P)-binding domain-containing protein [Actinoplanes utahensis]GIF30784.1 6-phosphogluconate dehydrogenase [Actinoplanes utahensis]
MNHVTVIGLGPMGRAMAAVLLRAGHAVTVWNRTPGRAAELITAGASAAATPADAVAAADLIILSLTDYQAMYDILTPETSTGLAGKVLVNLSSDTPAASRQAAAWATGQGARFLTGGVMVPAPAVGGPGASVFYSGPADVFGAHAEVLRLFGEPRHLGDDPGLAQLFYQAHLTVFLTGLSSLLQATAMVATAGVPAADFLPGALEMLTGIPDMIEDVPELARRLTDGDHPGDLSTVLMMGATADHIVRTSEALSIDTALPRAVGSHYDRAIAAGHGKLGWSALYGIIAGGGSAAPGGPTLAG